MLTPCQKQLHIDYFYSQTKVGDKLVFFTILSIKLFSHLYQKWCVLSITCLCNSNTKHCILHIKPKNGNQRLFNFSLSINIFAYVGGGSCYVFIFPMDEIIRKQPQIIWHNFIFLNCNPFINSRHFLKSMVLHRPQSILLFR